ncbi:cysteine-rich venom protein Mr30-like isoform X2 [Babylonia areolata]|uniref:cysteine-rich venom protein Mr30-like isoform X2 n=1 Tax=Babylonia areolata TaxID=304850 RepID=UPI003FCF39E7
MMSNPCVVLLLLLSLLVCTDGKKHKFPKKHKTTSTTPSYHLECDQKYWTDPKEPTHTRCLPDNPNAESVTYSEAVKNQVTQTHNDIRARMHAADMLEMKWDATLAETARKWAMQCQAGHDLNHKEPGKGGYVGQNTASASGPNSGNFTVITAVDMWYGEKKQWKYGKWTSKTGHFIQQISARTQKIGCGEALCTDPDPDDPSKYVLSKYVVCNYHPGLGSGKKPFKIGDPCEVCPDNCKNDLCDCEVPKCIRGVQKGCACDCHRGFYSKNCSMRTCEDNFPWCKYINKRYCNRRSYRHYCHRHCTGCSPKQ